MSKVIVFGGSGFLGSHLINELENRNYTVSNYDVIDGKNIIYGDVDKEIYTSDIVYHLAAESDIGSEDTFNTLNTNIFGTYNILEGCRRAKNLKRLVFASTIYVYSKMGSFYRISKQTCESLIQEYNRLYGIPYTILRYGSLYGPNANEHNWIHKMIKEALTTGFISVYVHGEEIGEEIREYIHVRDAAKLSIDILDKKYKNKSVIITGSQPIRKRDLYEMINEILGGNIELYPIIDKIDTHYNITPYSFNPQPAMKLVANPSEDMGHGILECIKEIYNEIKSK